jgi:hypothetical protein
LYAQPSLAILFYPDFNPANSLHKIFALVNFFGIWQTAVIGLGLQKWSEKGLPLAMGVSFAIWVLTLGLMYLMGFSG